MLNRLIELKQNIQKTVGTGIGVDIDETLSWTVGYWFKEMSKRFGNPEKRSTNELIQEYRYTFNVPYWQKNEAESWIENKRNSNTLQKALPLIPKANTYINKINDLLPVAAYITGRPEKVEDGTDYWLRKHNFPNAPTITRPEYIVFRLNNMWKAQVLEFLYPEVSMYIDDNPGLIHHLSPMYKGTIVLYGHERHIHTQHHVLTCVSWQDVYRQVSKHLKNS